MTLELYPRPRKLRSRRGALDLGGRDQFVLKHSSPRLLATVTRFCTATGNIATPTTGSPPAQRILCELAINSRQVEDYVLVIDDGGVRLTGKTEAGASRGLQTLRQIIAQRSASLPYLTIEDTPDQPVRGVMLDLSRCKVPTLDTLKQLVDRFEALKFNQLQLYIEHTFAFANHGTVWANASPLTASDINELQTWCEDRYIELVPNLNSFGHVERWLRHAEYQHLAECPDGFTHPLSGQEMPFGSTLVPNRKSLALLRELYDEYLPLFTSTRFNIGGDEPWELGLGRSRSRCETEGTTAVYLDFLRKIQRLVEERGRTTMFWSDIVLKEPDSLKQLSRKLIALNWGYESNHPFNRECRQMAAAGVPYYVCPGTSSWNALTGRFRNAEANLANAARAGLRHGAVGYLITDWGDHGHHQYQPTSYAGFLMGACHAWNHKASRSLDWADGLERVFPDTSDGTTGQLLIDLGQVLDLAPSPLRNATIFNRLLFWQMRAEPTATRDIPDEQIAACDARFLELNERLPGVADDLVRRELGNAIRLARHGCHRLQLFRGGRSDVTTLQTGLAEGIGEHEALWLARNRHGGLRESSSYLWEAHQALGG